MTAITDPRVIVALDFSTVKDAYNLTDKLDPKECRVKVGKELFTAEGPGLVENLVGRGFGVFLDLKYHDIPNTVAGAVRAACDLGVWMVNMHALGGKAMMQAAREARDVASHKPKLVAVTLLTSSGQAEMDDVGLKGTPDSLVIRLAKLTQESGLDGVVCSPLETKALREILGADFLCVTPGIRPAEANADDQTRIATPAGAILNGSTYEVIGRPITKAPNPLAALDAINREINEALHGQG